MAFEDFLDFLPLYPGETEDVIRARWDAWANEGRTVADEEEWTDTREGSFFHITTQPGVRESAREYDLMGTEVVMAGLLLWAWGDYLDDHGVSYNTDRNAAVAAEGVVRFTGPAFLPVPAGTAVAVEPVDFDADAPEYQTVEAGTIGGGGFIDLAVRATTAGEIGNVAANAVTVLSSQLGVPVTVNNPAAIVGGTDPESDEPYRGRLLARAQGQGGGNISDYEQWSLDQDGVGKAYVIPLFAGPGTVLVIVTTEDGDPVAQSVIDELQRTLDPPAFETTLTLGETLPSATIDVASTVGALPATSGHIRIGDQLVAYGSFDADSFNTATGGTGTFAIGTKVTQSGRGGGTAPVGHVVVVKTATALNVTIGATVEPETGYSLDGFGGTIALEDAIEESLRRYIESVPPGGEVVRTQVIAAIATVPGVHDVGSVTINGSGAGNLAVPGYPSPQVPTKLASTLVQGSV